MVLNNLAVEGILALGMMMLMIGGVFDLSVGSLMSLVGVVSGWLMIGRGWPVGASVAAGMLLGALGGFLNGLLVAHARVNALIATLGTLGIFQGLAILIAGPSIANLPAGFTRLGQSELLGLQAPVWLLLALAVVTHFGLRHTRLMRQYYYIGSNARAARLSGIEVERMQVLGFTMMGLMAGLAGLAFAARVGTAVSSAGAGAELRRDHRGHPRRGEPDGRQGEHPRRTARRRLHGAGQQHPDHHAGLLLLAEHRGGVDPRAGRGPRFLPDPGEGES